MKNTIGSIKSILSLSSLGLFVFFVFMQLTTWIPLRYWHIWGGGNFIDSQQILQWSECYEKQGNLVFSKEGECSGYIYGSALLKVLSFFKADTSITQIFGYLLMLVLAITISLSVRTFEKCRQNPVIFLVIISPPILLLAERGNFDTLMFALIGLAGFLFGRNLQMWALIPLAVATLIKFYSLPLFLLFFLLSENRKQKLTTCAVGIAVSIQVVFDLQLIKTSFPSGFSWKFGASIWTRYLTQLGVLDPGETVNNLSGLAILLFIIAGTLLFLKNRKILTAPIYTGHQTEKLLFYVFLFTHIACFLLGMSFDYRMIFLAVASVIYLNLVRTHKDTNFNLILVLTLISMWLTYPSTGLEPVGDLATEILTVILGTRALQLIWNDLMSQNAK
jgi:hypothetical protein